MLKILDSPVSGTGQAQSRASLARNDKKVITTQSPKRDTTGWRLSLITHHCISFLWPLPSDFCPCRPAWPFPRWRGWPEGPGVDVLQIGSSGLKLPPVSCLLSPASCFLFPVFSFPILPLAPSKGGHYWRYGAHHLSLITYYSSLITVFPPSNLPFVPPVLVFPVYPSYHKG